MLTLFMLLAAAGGILRLALASAVKAALGRVYWRPSSLAGALVVLAGLPEFIKPIPFPVPLGLTIGLLLPDLLLRRG
jgi:hypothetical protein